MPNMFVVLLGWPIGLVSLGFSLYMIGAIVGESELLNLGTKTNRTRFWAISFVGIFIGLVFLAIALLSLINQSQASEATGLVLVIVATIVITVWLGINEIASQSDNQRK